MTDETFKSRMITAIGADCVRAEDDHRSFMANDVYRGGGLPLFVVRPKNVADLQAAVGLCAAERVAMIPRGGGASYTDGYLFAPGGHVLFDLGGLNSIDIDSENATVTVGPGTTWAVLKDALAPHGVRPPFWGPFSGIAATVGGSLSQNTVSHGSGMYGISAGSVLSMDVVVASGELLRTSATPAMRHYGPDMTGLFTGDCGALGMKASITLPLIDVREHFEALSFAFGDFASFHAAERRVTRAQLDDAHFGLSLSLSQGQIAKQEGIGSRLKIAGEVVRSSPNLFAGARQLVKMALAGEAPLVSGEFMCHYIVEGMSAVEASAKAQHLRAIISPYGQEIANTVPAFVRAMPFAPLTNILGPNGERWVPLHGVLPHAKAVPFHNALTALYISREADMERLGVWHGSMFNPVGSAGFLYEVALYWPDARSAYHEQVLDAEYLAKLPSYPASDEAKQLVDSIKQDIIALLAEYDAGFFQLGRVYPYRERLNAASGALFAAIKTELDPQNLMNPGALA